VKYNYLDLLRIRQLTWMPINFHNAKISESEILNTNEILNWIRTKLDGRFFLSNVPNINQDSKLKSSLIVGFEDDKELTYFMLACPFLRR